MSRLAIETPGQAQTVLSCLYRDMGRRIIASQPGLCPVDMSLNFLRLCHAQTCGKCVPCRIGLGQLAVLIEQVLDRTATLRPWTLSNAPPRSLPTRRTAPSASKQPIWCCWASGASARTMRSTSSTAGASAG